MAYKPYKYDKDETLYDIAQEFNTTVTELAKINNIQEPIDQPLGQMDYLNGFILVPNILSGNESFENQDRDKIIELQESTFVPKPIYSSGMRNDVGFASQGACYIWIDGTTYYFPCYPESYTDSRQSNFTSQNPLGRSEPFQIYQNSGPRTVSVSFRMHREMTHNGYDTVGRIVGAVQSATYPTGNESIIPKVYLSIGRNCSIWGVIEGQVSAEWSETINKEQQYNAVNLSFTVTECTGNPKTSGYIASGEGVW